MKILSFTFEAPSRVYGGGIGIIQSLASLSPCGGVHYVGPKFDLNEFEEISIDKNSFLREGNFVQKVCNLLRGVSVRYYQEWKRVVQSINPADYNMVFVDFSYNDYIVNWAHKNGLRAIVRVHNIERDMTVNSINGSKHDKYWLRNVINGWIIFKREKNLMKVADRLIFLTKQDLNRACELYGESIKDRSVIIPVCMDSISREDYFSSKINKPYILSTGSLYYGPNSDGIKWFINDVWKQAIKDDFFSEYTLVIAGRNPSKDLIDVVNSARRVVLVDSPKDIYPYFYNAEIYIAPIFSGAGMKVKVAEALSYGLTVVGSYHALIGYEEAAPYVIEANSEQEFLLSLKSSLKQKNSKEECKLKYKGLYTLSRSQNAFKQLLEEICNEKDRC